MAEIISFSKQKKARRAALAKGRTLCANGFHRWKISKDQQFDVAAGKLITVWRCERCDAVKNSAL